MTQISLYNISDVDVTTINPVANQYLVYNGSVWTNSPLPFESTVAVSDETTPLTLGTTKVTFRMPRAVTLSSIRASLTTAQSAGALLTINVKQNGTSILSTLLTFDNGEKTTTTAATQPIISNTNMIDDAEITVDITQIGDGLATGLKVTLLGIRT